MCGQPSIRHLTQPEPRFMRVTDGLPDFVDGSLVRGELA